MLIYALLLWLIIDSSCHNDTNFLNDYGHFADSRMKAIGEYFSDLMGCGAEGWCAFRCCPTERSKLVQQQRRFYPNPASSSYSRNQLAGTVSPLNRYRYVNRSPAIRVSSTSAPNKNCAKACMPQCNARCLQRYNQIVSSFMNSLTAIDVMGQPVSEPTHNIRFSPRKNVECREECMPYCTKQCLDAYSLASKNSHPSVCKAVCMPECSEECVTAPPLMVPCIFDTVCYCPAGYVQCSDMTCCMKYKTMAIRYRNRMTSMSFSDDDDISDPSTTRNETSVYASELRKMGSSPEIQQPSAKISLPSNSTIVYYPEQGKAEIVKNDGSIVVEVMESAQESDVTV